MPRLVLLAIFLSSLAFVAALGCGDGGAAAIDAGTARDGAGLVDAATGSDGSISTDAAAQDAAAPADAATQDAAAPADAAAPDAAPHCPPNPTGPECSNCIDDDSDGLIDGDDVYCTSARDDDESSFSTGIPGDNMDATWQDCFFDGNSGAGNDDCHFHSCCFAGVLCSDPTFNPATDCAASATCISTCTPAVVPGCDCYGCCTQCNDADICSSVVINQAVPGAENCELEGDGTPVGCPVCVPSATCGVACDPMGCILCPGQSLADLPSSCGGQNLCPGGATACTANAGSVCAAGAQCLNGCCVAQFP